MTLPPPCFIQPIGGACVRIAHESLPWSNLAAIRNVLEGKGVRFLAMEDGMDGLLMPFGEPSPLRQGDVGDPG